MSIPNFPSISPEITREKALNMILASIAMEELGLSHIINAEGEKIQYVLNDLTENTGFGATLDDILRVNKSVESLLDVLMQSQAFLKSKMEKVIEVMVADLGPTGPTGPTGATGPKGVTGAAGPKGETGAIGPAGNTGNTGPAGPAGTIGPTGSEGPMGPVGPSGAAGSAGPRGFQGPPGPKGATGAAGPRGCKGATGPEGPKGDKGPTGPPGLIQNCLGSFSEPEIDYSWNCNTSFPWKCNFINGNCINYNQCSIYLNPCKYYLISFTITILSFQENSQNNQAISYPYPNNRYNNWNWNMNQLPVNSNAGNHVNPPNITIALSASCPNNTTDIFNYYESLSARMNSPISISSGCILYSTHECMEAVKLYIELKSPYSLLTGQSNLSIVAY